MIDMFSFAPILSAVDATSRNHVQYHGDGGTVRIEFQYDRHQDDEMLKMVTMLINFCSDTPGMFRNICAGAGLEIDSVYGNYDGKNFAKGDLRSIYLLQKNDRSPTDRLASTYQDFDNSMDSHNISDFSQEKV